jgi:hypothetical protein
MSTTSSGEILMTGIAMRATGHSSCNILGSKMNNPTPIESVFAAHECRPGYTRRPVNGNSRSSDRQCVGCGVLRVLPHGDRVLQTLNLEHQRLSVLTRTNAHPRQHTGVKTGKLRLNRVTSGDESRKGRDALGRCLSGFKRFRACRVFLAGDAHDRCRQDQIGLIDDGDAQSDVTRALRQRRPSRQQQAGYQTKADNSGAENPVESPDAHQ